MIVKLGGLLLVLGGVLLAQDDIHEEIKHILHPNMSHLYLEEPQDVENVEEMFTKGVFYGRVRFNSFGFKWKEELNIGNTPVRKDHAIAAMGGSLIYRSGYLNGFGVGAGLYVSEALGTLKKDEVYLYKAGKDTFSRYDKLTDGDNGIISLAQAYLEYKYSKTYLKAGRQIFESFLTKSNDTKMIPNTFEGITLHSKDIPQTTLKAAYLTRQKLRDHSEFHHVLAYAYDPNEPYYYSYTENDDSAMHRGLTLERLEARGVNDRLIIVEAKNHSIDNLTLYANYTGLPDLFSSAMIQTDYVFEVGEWTLIPGLRYMQQFDNGAGEIGGASRKGLLASQYYKDPNSLDSWLFGARLDLVYENIKLRAAYTRVGDEADIIAPWRGFPTGGFTRAMGQYNWDANTKTYMFQLDYQPEDFYDIRMVARFAVQDFDDAKPSEQADSNVFTLDLMKGFDGTSQMYTKLRYAHVMGEDDTPLAGTTGYKLDPSYDEVRFEINYLF
jgi:hypothetical protein